jgi:ribosomal protein S18 acetylase RimI-like enzyme
MPPEAFGPYVQASIAGYAEDNVASGRWPCEGALERSRAEFESLLPLGLATPDNHIFEIRAVEGGPAVGAIWIAVQERGGLRTAFVFDVAIHAAWRRQGHAMRAFQALENLGRELGVASIGLHVFGHNPGAQALYAKLGYQVTGINMQKVLAQQGG